MNLADFQPGVVILILLVLGILNCFFGYRIFRIVLALWGFVAGAIWIGSLVPADSSALLHISAALVGGLVGAAVISVVYFAGVFVAGAVLGFLVASGLASALGFEPNILISLIVAVMFGLLALAINKLVIIGTTAFAGAWSLVQAAALLSGRWQSARIVEASGPFDAPLTLTPLAVLGWIALGGLGIMMQYRFTAQDKKTD